MASFDYDNQQELIDAFDRLATLAEEGCLVDYQLPDGRRTYRALSDAMLSVCHTTGWNRGHHFFNKLSKTAVLSALNKSRERGEGKVEKLVMGVEEWAVHKFWLAARGWPGPSAVVGRGGENVVLPAQYPGLVVAAVVAFLYTGRLTLPAQPARVAALLDLAARLHLAGLAARAAQWLTHLGCAHCSHSLLAQLAAPHLASPALDLNAVAADALKDWIRLCDWPAVFNSSLKPVVDDVLRSLTAQLIKLQKGPAGVMELPAYWAERPLPAGEVGAAEFIVEWFKCPAVERKAHFGQLLRNQQLLQSLPLEFIEVNLLCNPLVVNDSQLLQLCKLAATAVKNSTLTCQQKCQLYDIESDDYNAFHTQRTCGGEAPKPGGIVVLGGRTAAGGKYKAVLSASRLRWGADAQWADEPWSLPRCRYGGAAAALGVNGQQVLLIGGVAGCSADGQRYDYLAVADLLRLDAAAPGCGSAAPHWSAVQAPHKKRYNCDGAVVHHNTKLVLAGGFCDGRRLTATEVFDSPSGRCMALGHMAHERASFAMAPDAAPRPSGVVATGGSPSPRTAERLDLVQMRWTPAAVLSEPRWDHAAATLGSRVFVSGGFRAPKSIEFLDARHLRWQPATHMLHPRLYHRLLALDDHRLVAVGSVFVGHELSVEIFDARNMQWCDAPPMNQARLNFQAVVV